MKKQYDTPTLLLLRPEEQDVIATSSTSPDGAYDRGQELGDPDIIE